MRARVLRRRVSRSWPAHRRTVTVGAATAILVLGGLLGTLLVQQPRWEAAVSLEVRAAPDREVDQVADRLALASPAIVEAVRSPAILRASIADADTTATTRSVADSVRVDVVTNPGSVTLSVTRASPVEARRLVVALARRVVDLDLLTPQARLVIISPVIEVVQVEPRRSLGLVLALGSAAAAGLALALAHAVGTRRVRSITDLDRVAGALGIAAVDARTIPAAEVGEVEDQVARLARWVGAPPHVAISTIGPLGPTDVADVRRRLRAGRPPTSCASPTTLVVVGRGTTIDLVRATVATARHRDETVSAVLLR